MERGSSQCLSPWLSSGDFRRLCFCELRPGRWGALPVSQNQSWGFAPLPSTLGQSLGQERACPVSSTLCGCRAPPLPENGPPVNSKSLPLSGKFKPVKTLGGTAANKYDLSHQEPSALCKLNFKFLPTPVPVFPTPAGCESAGTLQAPSPKGGSRALQIPPAEVVFESSWSPGLRNHLQVPVAEAWLLPAPLGRAEIKQDLPFLDPQTAESHLRG